MQDMRKIALDICRRFLGKKQKQYVCPLDEALRRN